MKTLLVVALVACGGPPRPTPIDPPAVAIDAAPAPEPSRSPTAAECDQLVEHALAVATPAGAKLSDDELARSRTNMHDAFAAQCLALPRAAYTCAMAAPTMADIAACDQATPRSSTSNSSVAPGGITPAAPRSP